MSYIRGGWPMRYVEGDSKDYVFPTSKPQSQINYIEDYGGISNEGIIEILHKYWKTEDTLLKQHILKRLAQNTKIKLRTKPLTDNQIFKQMEENMKNDKELQKILKTIPKIKK